MITKGTYKDIPGTIQLMRSFEFESKFVKFNYDRVNALWNDIISKDVGVFFVSKNEDKIIGAIGGIKYSDPNDGVLTAIEMFWYVHPEYRGSGIKLFRMFELWAETENCKRCIMVHLADLMPDKVKRIYESMGYELLESHYIKEL